jgi:hypothetical protein
MEKMEGLAGYLPAARPRMQFSIPSRLGTLMMTVKV